MYFICGQRSQAVLNKSWLDFSLHLLPPRSKATSQWERSLSADSLFFPAMDYFTAPCIHSTPSPIILLACVVVIVNTFR